MLIHSARGMGLEVVNDQDGDGPTLEELNRMKEEQKELEANS